MTKSVSSSRTEWFRDASYLGGKWVSPREQHRIDVENPATGEPIGAFSAAGSEDVDQAVAAARTALPQWSGLEPAGRAELLRRLHRELTARHDLLVDTVVAELGAPVRLARIDHIGYALSALDTFCTLLETYPFEQQTRQSMIVKQAAGVVGCITPWNYPLYQIIAKLGAALAAGCSVVLKPSELTPLTAFLFADAVAAAGLPAGTVNVVQGLGSSVGARLAAHPGVDVVSFTGSTTIGSQVAAVAAGQIKRVCLELGGKSASVLLPDADFDAAIAATVASATYNSGQTCSSLTRLLVPHDRYHAAVTAAVEQANALVVGAPEDEATDLGPLVSAQQRRRVNGYLERARADSARIDTAVPVGGPGHFVSPTIVSDVTPSAEIAQEEVFGPVLCVLPYNDVEQAIAIANGTKYGLAAAVWSADAAGAVAVARRLEAGQVEVNGADPNLAAPFGGFKQSGIGRELGSAGMEEFLELKAIQR